MLRHLITLVGIALVAGACGGNVRRPHPLFPMSPVWRAQLEDFVVSPLAAGASRLFVTTRSGTILALDQETGGVQWRRDGRPGALSAAPGRLILRQPEGTVSSLRVRNGEVLWTAETGVTGGLPATFDGDRVYVSGGGLSAIEASSGRILWTHASPSDVTAVPVATSARLLVGEGDGTLRCLDRATGVSLWTHATGGPIKAPPLVDEARRRIYLGTTDRRILEIDLDKGSRGWTWRVGADIQAPGLLLPDHVLFASYDAVLYALRRGGNLAWRSPLPSRPLSGPQHVGEHVVLACHESEILGFDVRTGRPTGSLRTAAEIWTPPLITGSRVFVGLRNRSVVSYGLPPGTHDEPER